ncbi:MAG TPA: NAD+ synthase [Acidimicrobiales bacterium]|nr:NAD+ synthase [Acidimicrobiales bacterium]
MGRIRVALCQLDAVVGDLEGNAAKVLAAYDEAESRGADLAVFPELVLTGYPPEDLLLSPSFVTGSTRAISRVAEATRRCAAVVGFVDAGLDLHNAAAVCAGGKVHGVWHKVLLPNYGVFDEQRWFAPGSGRTSLYAIAGARVGVTICEDAWAPSGPVLRQGLGGAELVVSINASPYRAGVIAEREAMLSTRAADASSSLVYVNLVGGQDELVFDGASMCFDADGVLVTSAPQFEEAVVLCDLEVRPTWRKRVLAPRGRMLSVGRAGDGTAVELGSSLEPGFVGGPAEDLELPVVGITDAPAEVTDHLPATLCARLDPVGEVYAALVLATRDYVEKNRFGEVVVALSGGIDSALVATVAADALGPERVHTVAMPSRYSSKGSLDDAAALAVNLGVEHRVLPIEPVHRAFLEALAPSFEGRAPDLAEENVQARARGTLIMALSNKFGWLVLTTGNKSEMAVGYATLYGDMNGGFAVIKDVPKTLVYALCELRNLRAGSDLVPRPILDKPPSAELRENQRDDDSLPPYDVLDPILEGYVEHDLTVAELVAAGHDPDTVRTVIAMVDRAEYKRRQAPPGPRVTSRGFGKDRRMPITNRYRPGPPSPAKRP